MLLAFFQIIILLLDVLWWLIIGQVVLSWLVAFNVINLQNDGVRRFLAGLERLLEPIYRPIRRILPDFGGLDFSPIVVILAISILQRVLTQQASMAVVG